MRRVSLADIQKWVQPICTSHFPVAPEKVELSGLTSNSKEVMPGVLFVAIRGESSDGHAFLSQAIVNGASLLIGESPPPEGITVPYIQVKDSRHALGWLASAFHSHPSHHLTLIGVTGTSGKTTTTYILEALLKRAGFRVGVLGTVNFRFEEK